jgi:hypothetical protein
VHLASIPATQREADRSPHMSPARRALLAVALAALTLGAPDPEPKPDRPTTPERPLPGRLTGA